MKSKIIGTVAVGVMSLAVVGTVVVNSIIGNDENSSYMPTESEVTKMSISEDKSVETQDPRIEQTNEAGWYIYDLNDIEISVSDESFLKVTEFNIAPNGINGASVLIHYSDPKDETATIIFETPISMIFTDSFGNRGKMDTIGNGGVGAYDLDPTSKKYTVTLEFAERDDVTIEITLP